MKSSVYYCESMNELVVVTQLYALSENIPVHSFGEIHYYIGYHEYRPCGYLLDMGNQPLYLESIGKIRPKLEYVGTL